MHQPPGSPYQRHNFQLSNKILSHRFISPFLWTSRSDSYQNVLIPSFESVVCPQDDGRIGDNSPCNLRNTSPVNAHIDEPCIELDSLILSVGLLGCEAGLSPFFFWVLLSCFFAPRFPGRSTSQRNPLSPTPFPPLQNVGRKYRYFDRADAQFHSLA